jgi:hypothetical protein
MRGNGLFTYALPYSDRALLVWVESMSLGEGCGPHEEKPMA